MTSVMGSAHPAARARGLEEGGEAGPRGRIRQRHQAAILKAAEKVFARAGFHGATMAEIAQEAGLPKANLHYYFGAKVDVYRAVLADILGLWLAETGRIVVDADPREALAAYIDAKLQLSARRPAASRVFANELLQGAPEIGDFLRGELRTRVAEKAAVIEAWIAAGKIAPLDPQHLFISLWALTQTYADFEIQVCAVLGKARLGPADYRRARAHVLQLVLGGCGLAPLSAGSGRSPTPPPRGGSGT